MQILVTGGTGLIGRALVPKLLDLGHQVVVLGRSETKIRRTFGEAVKTCTWAMLSDWQPDSAGPIEVVIHLAGFNIGACYWFSTIKKRIMASRIDTTTQLVKWCQKQSHRPRLMSASAVGIYGTYPDAKLTFDEQSKILQQPHCFSQTVVQAWEQAVMAYEGSSVRLRFGVVMDRHGGAYPRLALPFLCKIGCVMGTGQQPIAWVSLSDVIGIICFLLERKTIEGAINCTSPQTLTHLAFSQDMHRALPAFFCLRLPPACLKLMMGQMAEELLLTGQVVVPQRLIDLGYAFKHADFRQWLQSTHHATSS